MDFVALDVETANADLSSICQIGIAEFKDGNITGEVSTLIDPEDYFDPMNVFIHGITPDDVISAPTFGQVSELINQYLAGAICATHTHFDRSAFLQASAKHGVPMPDCTWLDTARVARRTWESVARKGYGLSNLASMLEIEFQHHDALEDAKAAGKVLCAAIEHSGIGLEDWIVRIKQPILGDYDKAIKQEGNPEGPLFGEVLVFTGALTIPRRQAAQMAGDLGCAVKSSISKKVSILVVGDQDVAKLAGHDKSSKHRRALDLISKGENIRIVRETDFVALLEHA